MLTIALLQVDEELLRRQQEAYKVAGVDEDEQIDPRERKKRKQQASGEDVSAILEIPTGKAFGLIIYAIL